MKIKIIIAGSGSVGSQLIKRLHEDWEVTVVDSDVQSIEELPQNVQVKTIVGDATSRLVLKKAGIEEVDLVVAVTGDDQVNLEICRLAKESKVPDIISVMLDEKYLKDYNKLEAQTVNGREAVAVLLENRIQKGKVSATSVGLGKGEIVEVPILASSHMKNRSLKQLKPKKWLVGAIYRDGKLIVPHGSTVIREDDRVLLVGEPEILPVIADLMKSGAATFPLQFGSRILVILFPNQDHPKIIEESIHVGETYNAKDLELACLCEEKREEALELVKKRCEKAGLSFCSRKIHKDEFDRILKTLSNADYGLVITGDERFSLFKKLGFSGNIKKIINASVCPILISKGSFPYDQVCFPAIDLLGIEKVAQLAIDVSPSKGEISAITVNSPPFLSVETKTEELKKIKESIKEMSGVHRRKIEQVFLEGNPVRQIKEVTKKLDLLVLGQKKNFSFWITDVSRHITHSSSCSVLILPLEKENGT